MRFHVVAMPQSLTTKSFSMCGFSQKTIRFCWMMKTLGHKVFLYAGTENEAICDEHIISFTEEDRKKIIQHSNHYAFPSWSPQHPVWVRTNKVVAEQINERKNSDDIICIVQGLCQKQIAETIPELKTVEYGIGYEGFFSKWKIFESHAWRSYCAGKYLNKNYSYLNDEVIHNFFDEREFCPSFEKKPYALFVGRIASIKGIEEACLAASKAGINLKIAGNGDINLIKYGAEYIGEPSLQERNKLMAEAMAVMCPSNFFEPFGNVACEAQLSATPVICTNWGGYTETVESEKTGFRCSTVNEMAEALKNVYKLDKHYILYRAVKMFSMRNKMFEFEKYFNRITM